MRDDEPDELFEKAFRELREDDRRAAPSFDRVLARARGEARPPAARRRWGVIAAAAVAILALAVGLPTLWTAIFRPPGAPAEAPPLTLASWESPTERLLRTPGRDLTGELPRLGSFEFASLDAARPKDAGFPPLRR